MDEATKQAVLSLVRSILVAIGGVLASKGVMDLQTFNIYLGAAMVILPSAWGIWDKFHVAKKAQVRETAAVNAGIALSNETTTPTPAVSPELAKAIIQQYIPAVPSTEGKP